MEIDFNRSPNIGGLGNLQGADFGSAEKTGRHLMSAPDPLTITDRRLSPTDGIQEVPESALRRDDPVGLLMGLGFRDPSPEMPVFD